MVLGLRIVCGLAVPLAAATLWAQEKPPTAEPAAPERANPAQPAPSETDATGPSDQVTAEEVLKRLRGQRPVSEVLTPTDATKQDASRRTTALARPLLPEGTAVISRPGRLVRDGQWWTFVFESDHPDHPEPPLKLLPNRSLEFMVGAAQDVQTGLVFVVSGELTVFQGENYLLATVAMRRTDSGNLRK